MFLKLLAKMGEGAMLGLVDYARGRAVPEQPPRLHVHARARDPYVDQPLSVESATQRSAAATQAMASAAAMIHAQRTAIIRLELRAKSAETLLAALVHRAGGEVEITPAELTRADPRGLTVREETTEGFRTRYVLRLAT